MKPAAMPPTNSTKLGRRAFLQRSGLAAAGSALPWALNLAAMGDAAAFNGGSSATDYKALVCVFLYGGNDYANTVIPYDTASYSKYSAIRGGNGIAIALADINAAGTVLSPAAADVPLDLQGAQRSYALHPSMAGMAGLFNTGRAAVVLNVGPLVKPLTRDNYNSSDRVNFPRPPQLFSHNDQQSVWQSSSAEGSKVGWGGRMGDRVLASATNAKSLFTCMSVTGNAVFLSGSAALQYQLGTSGAIKIQAARNSSLYGNAALPGIINSLVCDSSRSHKLERDYNAVTSRAIAAELDVTSALALSSFTAPATAFAGYPFPTDSLGRQLEMVARLIKGRDVLQAKRQVFMVSIGGFDLHDNLIAQHPALLKSVSDAIAAFYKLLEDTEYLPASGSSPAVKLSSQVTTFTASDFGRTLTSNGDGSDHGWGSHHFVVGAAVNGQKFYGTPPPVSDKDLKDSSGTALSNPNFGKYLPENQWHVGQGRLLPTTSVDQYAATLAKWFGVDDSEMASVLPNIVNFNNATLSWNGGSLLYPKYLGFMK